MTRRAYPSALDDETSTFMLPHLLLSAEDAPQRVHPLREVMNAVMWIARTRNQWAYLPHDFPRTNRFIGRFCAGLNEGVSRTWLMIRAS